jgi:protein involved in polysaccharide export with SLBB domain
MIKNFMPANSMLTLNDKGFPISVNGGYFNSGTYYLPPAFHLLDVLKASCDSLPWSRVPRGIEVDNVTVDIYKYLANGDEFQNPEIKAGMVIKIPYPKQTVSVLGDVKSKFMGEVPILPGETIESLLSLYTMNPSADTSKVILVRERESSDIDKSRFKDFTLKDKDYLYVPTGVIIKPPQNVSIKGEVDLPGIYPIVHGKTLVREVLDKSGARGDINRIHIYRKMIVNAGISPRIEVTSGIKNISGDIINLCGSMENKTLYDGDIIEVPKFDSMVYVSGYVHNPGSFTYHKDDKVMDYVKKAGGYNRAADDANIRVITSCGVTSQIRDVREINPGDIILVPEATESKWIKTWTPIIGVMGSTASVIAALISVSRK